MKKHIPAALIYLRLVIGIVILLLAMTEPAAYCQVPIVLLIVIGMLTDILDGIIARKIGVSSELLRRLDSGVDQVFWILVLAAAFLLSPIFFKDHTSKLAIVVGMEALTYLISYIKFRKEVATHAILSKVWTLTLFGTLIQIVAMGYSGWLFEVCFYLGVLSRLEIVLILLLLKKWTNDVPSLYHAILIRKGLPIKRNKWFNG